MSEKVTVNGVEIPGAVKAEFVVGKTIKLSDGREVEIRAGNLKMREIVNVAAALGAKATAADNNLALVCKRARWARALPGGEYIALTPEDILDLDAVDADELIEEALGRDFLERAQKRSQR